MKQIKQAIIPQSIIEVSTGAKKGLDLKAICVFSAIGFFLDTDTYWQHKKVVQPGTEHTLSEDGQLLSSKPYFKWHYSPREMSFETALNEFTEVFESIIAEQTKGQRVILPLSGGLDSRTQAAALKHIGEDVSTYSYAFKNGYPETRIAKAIAKTCDFPFQDYTIEEGYLWGKLDALAVLNKCQSDFTSPRQMAVANHFDTMGEVFSLGHWGDVLFDNYGVPQLSQDEEVAFLVKKLLKRGGLDLANKLWKHWGIDGNFESYLRQRISDLLDSIAINDTNAKLRAFKSTYWAPRWTSVNLSIFEAHKPITLPYYDNRMCEWICTIPEEFLANRQLQIAYIKKRNPALAKITWQDQRPFNLHNYHRNKSLFNLPYRISNKLKREYKASLGQPYVQRNWELQFKGPKNKQYLDAVLERSDLQAWVGSAIVKEYLNGFYKIDPLGHAHGLNMLLVFAKFKEIHKDV